MKRVLAFSAMLLLLSMQAWGQNGLSAAAQDVLRNYDPLTNASQVCTKSVKTERAAYELFKTVEMELTEHFNTDYCGNVVIYNVGQFVTYRRSFCATYSVQYKHVSDAKNCPGEMPLLH